MIQLICMITSSRAFKELFMLNEEKIKIKNPRMTIYNLTKEYEITKQGLWRWKKKNGRIKAYYCPQGMTLRKGAYVDNIEEDAAIVFC